MSQEQICGDRKIPDPAQKEPQRLLKIGQQQILPEQTVMMPVILRGGHGLKRLRLDIAFDKNQLDFSHIRKTRQSEDFDELNGEIIADGVLRITGEHSRGIQTIPTPHHSGGWRSRVLSNRIKGSDDGKGIIHTLPQAVQITAGSCDQRMSMLYGYGQGDFRFRQTGHKINPRQECFSRVKLQPLNKMGIFVGMLEVFPNLDDDLKRLPFFHFGRRFDDGRVFFIEIRHVGGSG